MIRKAQRTNPSIMDPTPDEIRRRTEAIRKTWSPRERARRSGVKRVFWTPPVVAETDLPGLIASDLESR